jgi:hypothetical protein
MSNRHFLLRCFLKKSILCDAVAKECYLSIKKYFYIRLLREFSNKKDALQVVIKINNDG